jgi:putative hydrolase of the HAD superfamily
MENPVVLCDADNTLWDTDAVFAMAQQTLLDVLEGRLNLRIGAADRVEYVRRYDQALASRHHLHLRYPVVLLVFALADGINGRTPEDAAVSAIAGHRSPYIGFSDAKDLAAEFVNELRALPALLPTVTDGLKLARDRAISLYVVTEGRIDKQTEIISRHELAQYFKAVFEISKTRSQFERLRDRFHPAQTIMVGDQLDRDIEPARRAGCSAVLVASRFVPSWNRARGSRDVTYEASDFHDAMKWVAGKLPS